MEKRIIWGKEFSVCGGREKTCDMSKKCGSRTRPWGEHPTLGGPLRDGSHQQWGKAKNKNRLTFSAKKGEDKKSAKSIAGENLADQKDLGRRTAW